jgi:hypothetical protein
MSPCVYGSEDDDSAAAAAAAQSAVMAEDESNYGPNINLTRRTSQPDSATSPTGVRPTQDSVKRTRCRALTIGRTSEILHRKQVHRRHPQQSSWFFKKRKKKKEKENKK